MGMYQSSLANLVPCIVMLGLDSAGKTTIFSNLMIKKSVETIPTYVFNVETVWPCKGVTIILRDVGEKEILRLLWQHYLANIQGLIFVVDKRKEESVRQGKSFLASLKLLRHDHYRWQARPSSYAWVTGIGAGAVSISTKQTPGTSKRHLP